MPATFNSGTYEIYMQKQQNQATPFAPTSPAASIGTSPKDNGSLLKKGALIAMGITIAKRTFDTVRSEIGASTGNEILQTNMNSAMKVVGYVGAILVGGIAGAVYTGTDIALSAITHTREINRANRKTRLEAELQGKRMNIASGSAYYG